MEREHRTNTTKVCLMKDNLMNWRTDLGESVIVNCFRKLVVAQVCLRRIRTYLNEYWFCLCSPLIRIFRISHVRVCCTPIWFFFPLLSYIGCQYCESNDRGTTCGVQQFFWNFSSSCRQLCSIASRPKTLRGERYNIMTVFLPLQPSAALTLMYTIRACVSCVFLCRLFLHFRTHRRDFFHSLFHRGF